METDHGEPAKNIEAVIREELHDISVRRGEEPASADGTWQKQCHDKKLSGLSLSGGGIRSATFSLGILQGLAKRGLLQKIDYLSTVSGGGYIGSWLQGVLHRSGTEGYAQLTREVPESAANDPVTFLRKYSNYLAPRVGLSLDAIVIPVIWFRNMLLNQTIIVSAFAALFLGLCWPGTGIKRLATFNSGCLAWEMLVLAFIFGAFSVFFIGYNLVKIARREFLAGQGRAFAAGRGTEKVGKLVVLPLVFGVVFLLCSLVSSPGSSASLEELLHGTLPGSTSVSQTAKWCPLVQTAPLTAQPSPAVDWSPAKPNRAPFLRRLHDAFFPWIFLALILWGLLFCMQWGGGFIECAANRGRSRALAWFHTFWMSLASALFMWSLFVRVSRLIAYWDPSSARGAQYTIAFAPPLYLIVLMLGLVVQIGLMGRDFPDSTREWLARAGALVWVVVAVWAGLFVTGVFAPLWMAKLWLAKGSVSLTVIGGWLGSTLASVFAGKSSKTNDQTKPSAAYSKTLDYVARFGPFIAIPGFLFAVAFAVQMLLHTDVWHPWNGFWGKFIGSYWDYFPGSEKSSLTGTLAFPGIAIAVFVLLSLRVDINEFSMHHFYKNRLVRCYMGASA